LAKGRRVLVQGRLQSRSWEQDGQKRSKVEVVANDVTFLDSRGGNVGQEQEAAAVLDKAPDEKLKPSKKDKEKEVVIEEIGDEPINLDDIPF
jgi:single-strand DNA-binding protein